MRRAEREIKDFDAILDIISDCECMHLGLNDNGEVYVVPVNYGYETDGQTISFYFHGAADGRKYNVMRSNPRVGFEMERNVSIKTADSACGHSAYYQSVIGNGIISFVEDANEKKRALDLVMKQNTGRGDWEYPDEMLDRTCLFRLDAESLSAKENRG